MEVCALWQNNVFYTICPSIMPHHATFCVIKCSRIGIVIYSIWRSHSLKHFSVAVLVADNKTYDILKVYNWMVMNKT